MKQLVVLSGKGGTGKTTVTAALAQLLKPAVLADCDVEAPNLQLLLSPQVDKSFAIKVSRKAAIDPELCSNCGVCAERCRYGAIIASDSAYRVDTLSCEGCGVCGLVCPENAVSFNEPDGARVYTASTPYGPMTGAELAVGEEASGKVVSRVRMEAQAISTETGLPLIIVDGSPGTGCPVIASMSGVDMVLIVTEPSVSGKHDLGRILEVAEHFDVPALTCINKYDLNPELARDIRDSCIRAGAEVAAEIPFREEVVEALRRGLPPMGNIPQDVEDPLKTLAGEIDMRLGNGNTGR